MKKILSLIFSLAILVPGVAFADFSSSWQATTTSVGSIFPSKINGVYPGIQVPYVVATSTARASTFPYASTTAISSSAFCLGTDCKSSWAFANPGGSDTNIQFNNGGAFGGSNSFLWDNTNKVMTIGDGVNDYPQLLVQNGDGTDILNVDGNNGAVGIGTSGIPDSLLQVAGSTHTTNLQIDTLLTLGNVVVQHAGGSYTVYKPAADTDVARGTALYAAVVNDGAKDIILVGQGGYDLGSNRLDLQNGSGYSMSLHGSGAGNTFVYSSYVGSIIHPGKGTTEITDLTVIATGGNSVIQVPIGCISEAGFGTTTLRGVSILGVSDALYNSCSTGSINAFNLNMFSNWDAVNWFPTSGIFNYYSGSTTANAIAAVNTGQVARAITTSNGNVNVYSGVTLNYGGGLATNYGIQTTGTGNAYNYGASINSFNTAGTVDDLINGGGTLTVTPAAVFDTTKTSGTITNIAETVSRGGTGATTFGQGWLYSLGGTGALAASTSPTVNYVTATSTTKASTFPYATTTMISATTASTTNLIISGITGTQCLHTISGVVSGTGADCGSGSGGANSKFATSSNGVSIYPNGGTNIAVVIGRTATTTNSMLEVNGTTTTTNLFSSASSTFAGGVNVTGGCIQFMGSCISQQQNFKTAVEYVTTVALPSNIYANGSSGRGATLTGVSAAALSVDSTPVITGDRVLVNNEGTQANNGIYTVTQPGSGILVYILTRSSDFDQTNEINPGDATFVTAGTTQATTTWAFTGTTTVTLGTTPIIFAKTGSGNAGTVSSVATGNGLTGGTITTTGTISLNTAGLSTNNLVTFDGTNLVATGTPRLTVGNLVATSTTASTTIAAPVGISTTTPVSMLDINGGFHSEMKTLATSTTMALNFCTATTTNMYNMSRGASNITFSFTNTTPCLGKEIHIFDAAPLTGVIATTTFSGVTWKGNINPGSGVVNGLTDEFKFISTASTTSTGAPVYYISGSYLGAE